MKTTTTYATRSAAYEAAAAYVAADLEHDRAASARAGYPVMMSADGEAWISDLGARFEANRADGSTANFWVDDAPETRAARAEAARLAALQAAETDRRAASAQRRLRETAADAVRAREAADLDRLAAELETAAAVAEAAREAAEAARAEHLETRAALQAADLADVLALRPEALQELAAASTSRAIDRREAETAADGRALRAQYAYTRPTLSETMNADAVQEAAAVLLEMTAPGAWIDGETADGTPRARLPLAYVAAIAAGRALDRVMYADGGHAVKMTARETRENYTAAARKAAETRARLEAAGEDVPGHVARLAEMNDAREAVAALEAEAAERPDDPETRAALRAARKDYSAAVAAVSHGMTPTETRRTVDPVSPSPEAAALQAETVRRIFEELDPADLARAVDLAREVYHGAQTADGRANIREAARLAGIPHATAARVWSRLQAAAAVVAALDRADGATYRDIDSDRRARAARDARRASAAVKADGDRLRAETVAPTGAIRFTAGRPDRLARTARFSPDDLAALAALARDLFTATATR